MGPVNAVREMGTMKRLLTRAEAEARSGGEQTPGPEHLLLAATALSDGTAARALERVGVGPQRLRTAIEEAHASALAAMGIEVEHHFGGTPGLRSPASGVFRSTPQAQQAFQEAVALARSTKPPDCRAPMSSRRSATSSTAPPPAPSLLSGWTATGSGRPRAPKSGSAECPTCSET